MPPKAAIASRRQNIAGFHAVQRDLSTQHLTPDVDDRTVKLAAQLSEAQATIDTLQASKLALSNQVSLLETKLFKASEALKVEQSQSAELYRCFRVERRARQRGAARKDFLESKIEILQATNAQHLAEQKQLIHGTMSYGETLAQLEKKYSNLQDQLFCTMDRSQIELAKAKRKLTLVQKNLKQSRSQAAYFRKRCESATTLRRKAVIQAKEKARQQAIREKSTHSLLHKGIYTQETRNLIHLLVKSGCSKEYVSTVITAILKSAGITTKGSISRRTVSRILMEGYVASQIQLGFEMADAEALTGSGDGTSHRNVQYYSRHINLKASDYESSGRAKQHVTRFLGITPSFDSSSEESIKDWNLVLDSIVDLYNRSPLGKRHGSLLRTVDIFAKLVGMMTDHCAKEKKDVRTLEELKKSAVLQQLGEQKILDSGNQELVPKFYAKYCEVISKLGGTGAWNVLPLETQRAHLARMSEDLVIDLGKDVYQMMSDKEKRYLTYFVWAGCGCHKDLNSVRGGYFAMSKWWEKHKQTPPILLANRDNAAVLADMVSDSNTITPAQERAFESTARGGIKATQLAGALFNHKDDKKGHHNIFRFWWRENVGSEFTFPDTSNTRFGSYCDGATAILAHLSQFIAYLEYYRLRKSTKKFNHMEQNFWNAIHDIPTLSELAVLSLYAQSISHPYMEKVRTPGQNALELGPYHAKVLDHIGEIISNPHLLIGPTPSFTTAALDGKNWNSPKMFEAVHEKLSTFPHICGLLTAFFKGAKETWKRFTSEFAPDGLIDQSTAEEKELAWMPATNDVNEGALGAFRIQMRTKPQLTMTNHNALAMFEHNDTQNFMNALFTESGDFKFLRGQARAYKGKDRAKQKEMVVRQQEKNQKQEEAANKRKEAAAQRKKEIEELQLELDKDKIQKMVGNDLKKQLGAFRNAGAPNLDKVSARSKVGDLKIALIAAILSLEAEEWNLPGQQKGEEIDDDIGVEDPEGEGEFIDLDVVEDDDACEWEDDDDL
jgi:hypothetical protein